MNRGIREFVVISGVSGAIILALYFLGLESNILHATVFAFFAFAGVTFLTLLILQLMRKGIPKGVLTSMMMAVIFIRLFITIAIILFYHQFYEPQSNWFIVPFFIFYLLYMVFENRFLINYSNELE